MLYVYKQFECPTTAAGVEVIIEVLDANNNYYEVGRTTSDLTGFYSLAFTPEVQANTPSSPDSQDPKPTLLLIRKPP